MITTIPQDALLTNRISKLYENHTGNHTFLGDLLGHIDHGYVRGGPDHLVMFYDCDGYGWHVWLAVGNLDKFLQHMPYYLPKLGWGRQPDGGGTVRWYDTDRLIKHL